MGLDRHSKCACHHQSTLFTVCKVYTIGYIKLVATLVKYMPQVFVNYRRQSTEGWSIWQVLLDITGGILSMVQLVIDASFQGDWSGITGNPTKLGLGYISIFFDIIFIIQHYVLYKGASDGKSAEDDLRSEEPLLPGR